MFATCMAFFKGLGEGGRFYILLEIISSFKFIWELIIWIKIKLIMIKFKDFYLIITDK